MITNEWADHCHFWLAGDWACFGSPTEHQMIVAGDTYAWIACGAHNRMPHIELQQRAETKWFARHPWLSEQKPRRLTRAGERAIGL